jgi:hypothetical protein
MLMVLDEGQDPKDQTALGNLREGFSTVGDSTPLTTNHVSAYALGFRLTLYSRSNREKSQQRGRKTRPAPALLQISKRPRSRPAKTKSQPHPFSSGSAKCPHAPIGVHHQTMQNSIWKTVIEHSLPAHTFPSSPFHHTHHLRWIPPESPPCRLAFQQQTTL